MGIPQLLNKTLLITKNEIGSTLWNNKRCSRSDRCHGRGGRGSRSTLMEGIGEESSGDDSENGDPALVAMRREGEARRAAMAAVESDVWLTGGSPSHKRTTDKAEASGSSPRRKRSRKAAKDTSGACDRDCPGDK